MLATSIAETSLTIEGVRIVVDCGLARVPRYEPDVGLTRLETVRVSRAAADQRRGRAGRTEPGVCYRLWDEPQTGSLEPYTRPEILSADLSSFVLDLAHWGVGRSGNARLSRSAAGRRRSPRRRALLRELGAIDATAASPTEGRTLRALPLPPRLARMVVDAAARRRRRWPPTSRSCSPSAASAATTSICAIGSTVAPRPLAPRRGCARDGEALGETPPGWTCRATQPRIRAQPPSAGAILALAYPDRIAKNRGGGTARSCSPMAAARTSIPPRRWRASLFSRWPN